MHEACVLHAVSHNCACAGSPATCSPLFTAVYAPTYVVCLQLIRDKGLTKLSGRTEQHNDGNIDAAEAELIWAAHKATETRLDLRSLVYRVSQSVSLCMYVHHYLSECCLQVFQVRLLQASQGGPNGSFACGVHALALYHPADVVELMQRAATASCVRRHPHLEKCQHDEEDERRSAQEAAEATAAAAAKRPQDSALSRCKHTGPSAKPAAEDLSAEALHCSCCPQMTSQRMTHGMRPPQSFHKTGHTRVEQCRHLRLPSSSPRAHSGRQQGKRSALQGTLLAAQEASKVAGLPVKSASQQEPHEHSAAMRVNESPQQEPQQASSGMLLSTTEESGLNMGVPAASEPPHIGSMDATDPLCLSSMIICLREELQHQVDLAGLDHRPQPESVVMLGKSIQQLPQQAFAKRKSAVQTVLDAPQQTLPDPVPGHQVPPAASAPTFSVSICHQPLVDMHCCRAERHCWFSCSSAAPDADADVLVYEQRWHSWVAPWIWQVIFLPCSSACKLGSE